MSDSESKHDKVLSRVHLWVAVLGGIVTLAIGLYNFKNIFFPDKNADKPAVEARAGRAQTAPVSGDRPLSLEQFLPMDRDGDGKVRLDEWSGTRENFERLDLDGGGFLNSQDFKGAAFESMDRNGDGSIIRLEWRKSRHAFDILDEDGDAKISPEEFNGRFKQ